MTIHSIDLADGGPSVYMQLLAGEMAKVIDLSIITLESPDPVTLDEKVNLVTTKRSSSWKWSGYSSDMKQQLLDSEVDVFHGNGLWQYPVHAMAEVARNRKTPYVISPHGMLEPWSMNQGKWKKKVALRYFQEKDLKQADVIHATGQMEAENLKSMGFKNPVAVIPNGVDTEVFTIKAKHDGRGRKKALFLSRIHPKKGLEMLINAWASLSPELQDEWELIITGSGEEGYIESLKQLVKTKNLEDSIRIKNPVYGPHKIELYQASDLFILPTYSENFGIVVTEALACGIPVITTKGTPWEDLERFECGWWIDPEEKVLRTTLEESLRLKSGKLQEMGARGRKLVEEKYSISIVAEQMVRLYQWVLDNKEKPHFIV